MPLPMVDGNATLEFNKVEGGLYVNRDDILDRAREMVPVLRERASEAEGLRRIPEETARDFRSAGFYRVLQPRRYGGLELAFGTQTELAIILAPGCASSAWVACITACHAWIFGMFPPAAQDEVWGADEDATISSSFLPIAAELHQADGGIRISGRWKFSSAVDYCAWSLLTMDVDDGSGGRERLFMVVPLADCTIEDTWHTTGLAGTGSNDIVVDDLFVPTHRTVRSAKIQGGPSPGSAVNDGYLYRLPQHATFSFNIVGTAIGGARGAIRAAITELTGRNTVSGARLAELSSVHLRVAEAEAEVAAAYALMARNRDEIIADAEAGRIASAVDRARYRRDNAYAGRLCVQAVDRIYPLMGGRGIATDSTVNRAWRDVHAVAHHIALTWDNQAAPSGALAVGVDRTRPNS